jgi:hypothetical protein
VYLWHWPVYMVLDPGRMGLSGWTLLAVRIGVTIAIAIASYLVLEQPIRHGAFTARTWRVATPALAVGAVAMVIGATLGAQPPLNASRASVDSVTRKVREAERAGDVRRVMVVGNSLGYYIGRGMQELDPERHTVVLDRALVACAFPSGATEVRFDETQPGRTAGVYDCDRTWQRDVAEYQPDLVFFIAQCCATEYKYGGRWLEPCDPAYRPFFARSLDAAVATLGAAGARVVVVTSPYTLMEGLSATARANLDCSNALRREFAPRAGARVADLAEWTCPRRRAWACRTKVDGVELRPDGVHFQDESARLVARWLFDEAESTSRS